MSRKTFVRRPAFTLVELLVVIAIIGILVALLLPAVQAAREAARRMSCSNNLKNLALGCQNYHDVNKCFPFGHLYRGNHDGDPGDNDGGTGFSWAWSILPFIEQQSLFDQFDPTLPIGNNSPSNNRALMTTPLSVFACPSDTKPEQYDDAAIPDSATSSYQGCATSYNGWDGTNMTGNSNERRYNGVFERCNRGGPTGMRHISDGTTNTVLIAETKWKMDGNQRNRSRIYGASDQAGYATGASNALMVNGQWAINWTHEEGNSNPHRTASSMHPGGAQFAFVDGSVHFLSETIDHTATAWIDNAHAYHDNNDVPYGTYQRLFSVGDGLVTQGF